MPKHFINIPYRTEIGMNETFYDFERNIQQSNISI